MKMTAPELLELGVIDGIIPEPAGGAHEDARAALAALDAALVKQREALAGRPGAELATERAARFRAMTFATR